MVQISKEEEEESGTPYREKSAAKQYMTRKVRRHSKREEQSKEGQENLKNVKRSIVKHWDRKDRYL